jgi:hypothetical protein
MLEVGRWFRQSFSTLTGNFQNFHLSPNLFTVWFGVYFICLYYCRQFNCFVVLCCVVFCCGGSAEGVWSKNHSSIS